MKSYAIACNRGGPKQTESGIQAMRYGADLEEVDDCGNCVVVLGIVDGTDNRAKPQELSQEIGPSAAVA